MTSIQRILFLGMLLLGCGLPSPRGGSAPFDSTHAQWASVLKQHVRAARVDYAEPRIHFALVCAAKGCPPLRAEALVGSRRSEQLGDQARAFLAESGKNRIEAARKAVFLSPIFKWYGADFEAKGGSVLGQLKPYWREEWRELPLDGFKIRYTEYDWTLNDRDP